jgi:hypothetical protein
LTGRDPVDTVLVDGRFRVACTLRTILECHQNTNLRILIHDFSGRENYQVLRKYLHEVARVESLAVFTVKEDLDISSVMSDYEQYKYDPA